ncbi:hypothetical protein [Parasedimentitalea denitrificans]|uniref:hypothetical protein n=1 Tax=Parasedimentitalea denitrificans TaxID=2211118 RepID=UPI0014320133|nr:hypothetical protein [Sedimentitalea sp. CY04]
MHRLILSLMAVVALTACGVDGEPVQPTLNAGVGVSSSGVNVGGAVGLHKGPMSLYLGF